MLSNDSDLVEPIRIVAEERVPVGVYNPQRNTKLMAHDLRKVCSFYRHVTRGDLINNQFPDTLCDAAGTFTKPAGW